MFRVLDENGKMRAAMAAGASSTTTRTGLSAPQEQTGEGPPVALPAGHSTRPPDASPVADRQSLH